MIYIPGNHEFYGSSVAEANKIVGEHSCVRTEVGGHWFVRATLWFAYRDGQDRWKDSLNDFHLIEGFDPWVYEENKRHEAFLRETVQQGDIVVTHHLPSYRSVHPRYAGLALNQFFVHEMDDLIEERKPALFIHGHTHEPCDYKIGETRVICNPLGYPNEYPGRHWEPKIVEV